MMLHDLERAGIQRRDCSLATAMSPCVFDIMLVQLAADARQGCSTACHDRRQLISVWSMTGLLIEGKLVVRATDY